MSDERHFANPFCDSPPTPQLVDAGSGQLLDEHKQKLLQNVAKLLTYFEKQVPRDPNAGDYSVYTGIAGYAYLYLQLSETLPENRNTYIEAAYNWCERALRLIRSGKSTFLCGSLGPIALSAVVYHKKSMADKSVEMIKRLVAIDTSREQYDEMLYGRAGILYALLFVKKAIATQTIIEDRHIRNIIEHIIKSGQKTAQKEGKHSSPLYYYWHDSAYVGAAHGFIGILCMLLECKEYLTNDELSHIVRPTIDFIHRTFRMKSGNYMSSAGSKSDRLVHWCHGAPGAIFLFCLAYQVFQDKMYLNEAISCGEVIWQRGILKKGYGICHGTAGNAYAFLRLYQLTNDEKYVYRALKFAEWCYDYGQHGCRTPDRPLSLFEGLAGTIYFLSDLITPANARFPAFQLSI
ncbi:lanC-like protein 2 [Dinothrombium tinctorium]|uniref:LanC-like protein 2 n=1 Tax=Dinothrombium tinctorium TaxID=1965070 RepID=A0A443QNI8_9ACAR|nr:lanC-like protein 2 [Dinothrombium tinctorium]